MEKGYTFLKMDVGIGLIRDQPGALNAPDGVLQAMFGHGGMIFRHEREVNDEQRALRNRAYDANNIPHPFTGVHVTEKGLDLLEQYVADVRGVIGMEVPLAIDHFGHIALEDCIRLARRLEKYCPVWLEDMIPWQLTEQYVRLARSTAAPICTGEDIYLKENFRPLLQSGGVSVIHPDVLTSGGILETKKVGDMAQEHGVAMAVHMAESPVGCLAAAHACAATENFLALEYHSVDVPWWDQLVRGRDRPIVENGFIEMSDQPGLGIEDLNDEVIAEHLHPAIPGLWEPTDRWDNEWSHDRLWS
jgi:L-alanine-DL-glutamate epimerase-like enolase superfamily enzyme